MVNQSEALRILNKEKDYEDGLSRDILGFLSDCTGHCPACEKGICTQHINDMTKDEKDVVKHHLHTLITDTREHSALFATLIEWVLEHGESNY